MRENLRAQRAMPDRRQCRRSMLGRLSAGETIVPSSVQGSSPTGMRANARPPHEPDAAEVDAPPAPDSRQALEALRDTNGFVTTSAQSLGLGVLISESFTGCSVLCAKLEGLKTLINDDSRPPIEVVTLLQGVFDRFDALAEMYDVQKVRGKRARARAARSPEFAVVAHACAQAHPHAASAVCAARPLRRVQVRKSANEVTIFAAGLPNPELLPTPETRACACAAFAFALIGVMETLNVGLAR